MMLSLIPWVLGMKDLCGIGSGAEEGEMGPLGPGSPSPADLEFAFNLHDREADAAVHVLRQSIVMGDKGLGIGSSGDGHVRMAIPG